MARPKTAYRNTIKSAVDDETYDGIRRFDFAEYLGIHVLRSAYGVLHPAVVADRNLNKSGISGTEIPKAPEGGK